MPCNCGGGVILINKQNLIKTTNNEKPIKMKNLHIELKNKNEKIIDSKKKSKNIKA